MIHIEGGERNKKSWGDKKGHDYLELNRGYGFKYIQLEEMDPYSPRYSDKALMSWVELYL